MRQKKDLIIGRKYYLDVELEITAVPSPNLERQQHRSSFSFYCGEGVSKFVADLLRHNLAAKGGNGGRWSDVAQQAADERVPLYH